MWFGMRRTEYSWFPKIPAQHKYEEGLNYGRSGIYNVHIKKDKSYKQGYIYTYPYVENGKNKLLSSISLEKLKEKVESKNLEWYG